MMTLSYVVLFVKDMEKTLAVYADVLGLEISRRYMDGGDDVAFLVEKGREPMVDDTLLEIVCSKEKAKGLEQVFLGFEVKDLSEATGKMTEAGCRVVNGPYSPDEGVSIITLCGPDGETIELMQNA